MIKSNEDFIREIVDYIRSNEESEIKLGGNKLYPDEEDDEGYFLSEINKKEYWILFQDKRIGREGKSFIHVYDWNRDKKSLLQYTIDGSNFKLKRNRFTLYQNRGITIGRKVQGLNEIFKNKMIALGFNESNIIATGGIKKPDFKEILKDIFFWIDKRISAKLELETKYRNIENETFENEIEDEPHDIETKTEGGKKVVISIKAERDTSLRDEAIRYHGLVCKACGFDFYQVYGEWGKGFIEVHHIIPLAEYRIRETDVKNDLTVLCSNCHRMIHRKRNLVLTIQELKKKIKNNS